MTQRKRREHETTEQRRERYRVERERESPETRERRLAADRERKRLMWLNATPEQKEAIKERDRERYRNSAEAKRRAEAKLMRTIDKALEALEAAEAREARKQAEAEKRMQEAENAEFVYRWRQSAKGAGKRRLLFDITVKDLRDQMDKQGRRCAYTGEFLPNTDWSVDRVDSAEGYVPGNIVLCTKWANVAKWMLSASDFIAACRRVVEYADNSTPQPHLPHRTVTDGNRQDPPT